MKQIYAVTTPFGQHLIRAESAQQASEHALNGKVAVSVASQETLVEFLTGGKMSIEDALSTRPRRVGSHTVSPEHKAARSAMMKALWAAKKAVAVDK